MTPVTRRVLLGSVQAAAGVAGVSAPGFILTRLGAPATTVSVSVTRVLAGRTLAQGVIVAATRHRAVLRAGAAIDAAHALSMVLLIPNPRWRAAALASAAFALSTAAAAGFSERA